MRSGQLHQALHAFSIEAGAALTAATARGEEVGFEVVQDRPRTHRPALYCYQPLTGEFIARHWHELRAQPSAPGAIAELSAMPGLSSYLELHAVLATDEDEVAETALRCFVARVFDGCDKTFVLIPERFEPAYRELFETALEQRTEIALLGLLRGVSSTAKEIALGEGTLLAPLERLGRVPPDPAWARGDCPALVVAIDPGDEPDGVERALAAMLELQSAMRLYAGGISFAPLAWIHSEGTHWRALSLSRGGRSDGRVVLVAEQQEELRSFCAMVARRRPSEGLLGWAMRRFELGCEREDRLEGLSDHLLALRALLEPEGAGSGRLPGRLAALCAEGPDSTELAKRMMRALQLEQAVIGGGALAGGALALAAEVEERLRSLLRDVIAGQLRGDLAAVADSRIYMPEADAGFEPGEFQVTRANPGAFGADLFATPQSGLRPGVSDDSVFEPPTTELHRRAH
jgi:hypothetical protein